MIEPLGNIPCHLHVLLLISPYRHLCRFEHQDIGSHQDRVVVEGHDNALVWIGAAALLVRLHLCLVGMRTIHQAFCRHAVQNPGQFRNLRDIRLPVEIGIICIEATCKPRRRDFQPGALNAIGCLSFRQRMVIGEKIEVLPGQIPAGGDCRADGTDIVADVRGTGRRDTGEICFLSH